MRINLAPGAVSREWCDICQTTAILAFTLYNIGEDGVAPAGFYRACQRCTP